jgi:hypothetical protein
MIRHSCESVDVHCFRQHATGILLSVGFPTLSDIGSVGIVVGSRDLHCTYRSGCALICSWPSCACSSLYCPTSISLPAIFCIIHVPERVVCSLRFTGTLHAVAGSDSPSATVPSCIVSWSRVSDLVAPLPCSKDAIFEQNLSKPRLRSALTLCAY